MDSVLLHAQERRKASEDATDAAPADPVENQAASIHDLDASAAAAARTARTAGVAATKRNVIAEAKHVPLKTTPTKQKQSLETAPTSSTPDVDTSEASTLEDADAAAMAKDARSHLKRQRKTGSPHHTHHQRKRPASERQHPSQDHESYRHRRAQSADATMLESDDDNDGNDSDNGVEADVDDNEHDHSQAPSLCTRRSKTFPSNQNGQGTTQNKGEANKLNGGYYAFRPGEIINQTYEIKYQQGRGVFSNVVFARRRHPSAPRLPAPPANPNTDTDSDIKTAMTAQGLDTAEIAQDSDSFFTTANNSRTADLVAVKILRKHKTTRRAGSNEESILKDIHKLPLSAREFIVDFIESFVHKRHLCLVFRAMKLNLRQLLVKYGRNTGIHIDGVRRYGSQIFSALRTLCELGIVHADVKLDNIIVSADLRTAKLCDFGSAFYAHEARGERTMYLVSRFYRAPELVLGLSGTDLSSALDVWSLGTCLFELYSGNVLFPGRTNNEMLALFMRTRGKIPLPLVKRHLAAAQRLDTVPLFEPESFAFREILRPPRRKTANASSPASPSKQPTVRFVRMPAQPDPASTISRLVHEAHPDTRDQITTAERRQLSNLLDLALALDPAQRITPSQALALPFFITATTPQT